MAARRPAAAAAAIPATPVLSAPPTSLEGLHRQVQERLGWILFDQPSVEYVPIRLRYHNVTRLIGPERVRQQAELHRDLVAIADADSATLQRMAFQQSTTVACHAPKPYADQLEALAAQNAMRPRATPAELLDQFARRGIVVASVEGALHVSPADRLTEGDREVLTANKAGILAALARPVAVL